MVVIMSNVHIQEKCSTSKFLKNREETSFLRTEEKLTGYITTSKVISV